MKLFKEKQLFSYSFKTFKVKIKIKINYIKHY